MGNYQEYVKNSVPPLREIDTQPVRQHTFGNPFKVNKVWTERYILKYKPLVILGSPGNVLIY